MNRHQQKQQRLVNLITLLLRSRRPLTAAELRAKLTDDAYSEDKSEEAFRRTFERDKKDLLAIGIPLTVTKWDFGNPAIDHYGIEDSVYAERDISFTAEELAALHLATRQVRLPGVEEPFLKTGIPSEDEIEKVVPDSGQAGLGTVGELPFDRTVSKLAAAAAKGKCVEFHYQRPDQKSSYVRTVEPWRMSFDKGHWYLVGWDRVRSAERLFRVDRIKIRVDRIQESIREIDRATHPVGKGPDLRSMKPWHYGPTKSVEVKILVDATLASWASHNSGVEGTPQPDGSVILTLSVNNPDALRGFVISMFDHVEILEPSELRDDMIAWLKALV